MKALCVGGCLFILALTVLGCRSVETATYINPDGTVVSPAPAISSSPSGETTSPSPSTNSGTAQRSVNVKAETLLGSEAVPGVRIDFLDINGKVAGSVTTRADGTGTLSLPAVKTPPYWGAYYKLSVTMPSGHNYSVITTPFTGGSNDLMVPPLGGTGDGSQPPDYACSVLIQAL